MRQNSPSGIPHQKIRDEADRSWSLTLVEAIKNWNPEEDYEPIISTLVILDDYRTVEPLLMLAENLSLPSAQREVASDAVRSITTWESAARRRHWLESGDAILIRQGITLAERQEADLLEQIAQDPHHTHYAQVISRLGVSFQQPKYINYVIRALDSPNRTARLNAVDCLVWAEPIAATDKLLEIARHDQFPIGEEALGVLAYMHQRKVLLYLYEALPGLNPRRQQIANNVIEELKEDFTREARSLWEKDQRAFHYISDWLEPINHILNIDEEALSPPDDAVADPSASIDREVAGPSVDDVIEHFSSDYGHFRKDREFLRHALDSGMTERDEKRLVSFLHNHRDWFVRDVACSALPHLASGPDALYHLLFDEVYPVRKAAAYFIREAPPDNRIASKLLCMITEDGISGSHGSEAIESYCHHSSMQETTSTNAILRDLAQSDDRESITNAAVHALWRRRAREHVQSLLPMLARPPLLNWSTHNALLGACHELNVPIPNLADLRKIDDLWIQATIAEILAKES